MNWKPITDQTFFLAESALWDCARGCYFFVDIFAGKLYQYFPEKAKLKVHSFDDIVSACVLSDCGELVLATQKGIGIYDPETGVFTNKVHPNADFDRQSRYNDCKCDPAGRLFAGTMDLQGRPGLGKLFAVEKQWKWRTVLDAVDYSNGLVWIGSHMYYTDTWSGNVYRFDYCQESGSCTNRRVLCTFPAGQPDGMAADRAGRLWIALWGGHGIACVNPETGDLLCRAELPVPNVSSLCFGRNGTEVLVTTARKDLSDQTLSEYPLSGSVFLGTLDTPGNPFGVYRPA